MVSKMAKYSDMSLPVVPVQVQAAPLPIRHLVNKSGKATVDDQVLGHLPAARENGMEFLTLGF